MQLIDKYLNSVVNFDIISKVPTFNYISMLPKIKSCTVQISLKINAELNYSIVDSFIFLEWLTGQRPFLKKVGFLYRSFKPLIHVLLHVTLRRFFLKNFLYYILICGSLMNKKSISIMPHVSRSHMVLIVHDINFFFNIPESLYKFNEPVCIVFELESASVDISAIYWSSFSSLFVTPIAKK